MRCATTSPASRPTARARQFLRHRQSGGGRTDRQGDRGQRPHRASTTPAARSIACCAPSTTGSPAGTSRRTGSPTGTCSASRRPSRTTRAASRKPGGSTPTRRPSSIRRNSPWAPISSPHPADHPDHDRDHGDQLRRRAVRAGRAGRAGHRAAFRAPTFGRPRAISGGGGDFPGATPTSRPAPAADCRHLEISRRAGARPGIHQEAREAVRLRQAAARALRPDAVELCPLRFRPELFPRHQRARS